MRGRVSRAMSRPPTTTSMNGPMNDSKMTSQFAVSPTGCIAPLPVVVNIADAEAERAQERIGDAERRAAVERGGAEGRVGEREDAVREQQRGESPAEEGGPAGVERAEVEAAGVLRAEPVLAARRLAVVRQEAPADLLRDDLAEAEIRVVAGGGGRGDAVLVVDGGCGHAAELGRKGAGGPEQNPPRAPRTQAPQDAGLPPTTTRRHRL